MVLIFHHGYAVKVIISLNLIANCDQLRGFNALLHGYLNAPKLAFYEENVFSLKHRRLRTGLMLDFKINEGV